MDKKFSKLLDLARKFKKDHGGKKNKRHFMQFTSEISLLYSYNISLGMILHTQNFVEKKK